ncbi:MAG: hypothetical protein ABI895_05815 [Deltaproteobacteria bacterium]
MRRFRIYREFAQTGQRNATSLCLLLALACMPDAARRGQAGHEQAAGSPGRPALDLSRDAAWPAAYDSDPLWRRAAAGSDFERARLAQSESAAALLVALSEGGSLGRTALAVLPYAEDRREVVGRLCALALGPVPPTSSWLLAAIHEAIANGPRTEESVDPGADALCTNHLRQLAERADTSPEDRDRALGAISLLAKR